MIPNSFQGSFSGASWLVLGREITNLFIWNNQWQKGVPKAIRVRIYYYFSVFGSDEYCARSFLFQILDAQLRDFPIPACTRRGSREATKNDMMNMRIFLELDHEILIVTQTEMVHNSTPFSNNFCFNWYFDLLSQSFWMSIFVKVK